MKLTFPTGILPLALLLAAGPASAQNVLKYVNPNIGTAHSRWFFYTPAAVPYGMAKLAPSTNGHYGNASGWEAVGYDTRQNSIEGFVHFHEWQVGGVSFMPTTGELRTQPGDLDQPGSGYRSRFDRKDQVAEPGYYKVLLADYGITAELTATKRVGFHRERRSDRRQHPDGGRHARGGLREHLPQVRENLRPRRQGQHVLLRRNQQGPGQRGRVFGGGRAREKELGHGQGCGLVSGLPDRRAGKD
jgi:hypothetical protein